MADSNEFKISGTGEGVCSVDKDHAALLTFTSDLAMYSHVYLELPAELFPKSAILTSNTPIGAEVDPEIIAYYMFKYEPMYDEVTQGLIENEFPMYLNLRAVEPEVITAFDTRLAPRHTTLRCRLNNDSTDEQMLIKKTLRYL